MSAEPEGTLDTVYGELKQLRDEMALKVHLGGMELRETWNELEREWDNWVDQLKEDLQTTGDGLEKDLRKAGGEDLRKLELKTKVIVSKLERGLKDVSKKLEG
jgi:hypothetical protein